MRTRGEGSPWRNAGVQPQYGREGAKSRHHHALRRYPCRRRRASHSRPRYARAGMAPCYTNQTSIEKPRRACLLLLDVANAGHLCPRPTRDHPSSVCRAGLHHGSDDQNRACCPVRIGWASALPLEPDRNETKSIQEAWRLQLRHRPARCADRGHG